MENDVADSATLVMFDYGNLPAASREKAIEVTYRIRSLHRTVAEAAIEIGKLLIDAKPFFPKNEFMSWAKTEFGYSLRTLNRYIAVAGKFGDVTLNNALPAKILYELVESDATAQIADNVIEKAKFGKTVDPGEIRRQIDEARQEAREEARAEARQKDKALQAIVDELTLQRDALQTRMETMQGNMVAVQDQLTKVSAEMQNLKDKGGAEEERVRRLQAEIENLERQKGSTHAELIKLSRQSEELESDISRQKNAKQAQRAKIDKLMAYRQKLADVLIWIQEANVMATSANAAGIPPDMHAELQSIREIIRSHHETLSTLLGNKQNVS